MSFSFLFCSRKQFVVFDLTFGSIPGGTYQIVDVFQRFGLVKLVQNVLETLSLTNPREGKARIVSLKMKIG